MIIKNMALPSVLLMPASRLGMMYVTVELHAETFNKSSSDALNRIMIMFYKKDEKLKNELAEAVTWI